MSASGILCPEADSLGGLEELAQAADSATRSRLFTDWIRSQLPHTKVHARGGIAPSACIQQLGSLA